MFRKAISCVIVGLLLFLLYSSANAYTKGDIAVGASFKTATPFLGSYLGEFDVLNKNTGVLHDAKLGKQSVGGNFSASYFVTDTFSVGPTVLFDWFPYDKASGLNQEVKTSIFGFGLLSQLYIIDLDQWLFYVPLMVGYSKVTATIKTPDELKFTDRGFAFYSGFGIERHIADNITLYFEALYNYNCFKFENADYKLGNNANFISYSIGVKAVI